MHSFGQTFAHSSQPMHLYQSMLCWPRKAWGRSTFWYGYRCVTGLRPPGTSLFTTGSVISVFRIAAPRGRRIPRTVPVGRTSVRSWSDLGDFIRVVSFLEVHELALAGTHEAALLRLD